MHHWRSASFADLARAAAAALLLIGGPVSAQDVTEPALKAAFIYNFAKFTAWPADVLPAGEPLVMCILNDEAVRVALERLVKDRLLEGHAMSVSGTAPGGAHPVCQVLYMSGITSDQAARLIAGLSNKPVLTISDLDGFIKLGGIAQFFYEQGRLRFSVQVSAAERARLRISSRLLVLAVPR